MLDTADANVVAIGPVGGGSSRCTGTLVAPRLVVTAGHCDEGGAVGVYFGNDPTSDPGVVITSIAHRTHPGYDPDGLLNDVALFVLAQDAPTPSKPLWTEPFTDAQNGAALRLVGFGSTRVGPPGPKYEGRTVIDSFTDETIAFHANPAQTCSGDSGGPAFMTADGVERLVGITSSGDPTCETSAHDMRVDPYATRFIGAYELAIAAGQAALGHHCVDDANCESGTCLLSDDDPDFSYCSRSCQTASDCAPRMGCDPIDGALACHFAAGAVGALGAPCDIDFDCGSGVCGAPIAGGTPACTTVCADQTGCTTAGYQCNDLTSEVMATFKGCARATTEGGCAATSNQSLAALVLVVFIVVRRRRPRARLV